ncbi:fimbrial protein [Serratia ureilytica]|uniref:fimbrial protein n=1 Tax=Serratia ureilytica TaxID=300181 RepID=UPI001C114A37|nr:fimbrial protein [Serratia ureilytica]MBU5412437.1 fimbrial protein [Serratia ureilytica]
MFKFAFFLFMISVFLLPKAYSIQCQTTTGSPYSYSFNYSLNSGENYVGYSSGWQKKSTTGAWVVASPCNDKETLYYSSQPGERLTLASSEGGVNWYDVQGNDYIQIASQVLVYNKSGSSRFYSVPFLDVSNNCGGGCGGAAATGSSVMVNFRIKRRFIGSSHLNDINVFKLYANNGRHESYGTPVVLGKLSMTMVVPQKCELNAGEIVTIDFGNIASSAFKTAGVKASGVSPISRSINIKCNGTEAQASLTLRIQAGKTSGNVIVSDNRDVGFSITDANNQELTPNSFSSVIPFDLDGNASANITLKAYPVSVTGNKPAEGFITSQGYLRVDFS